MKNIFLIAFFACTFLFASVPALSNDAGSEEVQCWWVDTKEGSFLHCDDFPIIQPDDGQGTGGGPGN